MRTPCRTCNPSLIVATKARHAAGATTVIALTRPLSGGAPMFLAPGAMASALPYPGPTRTRPMTAPNGAGGHARHSRHDPHPQRHRASHANHAARPPPRPVLWVVTRQRRQGRCRGGSLTRMPRPQKVPHRDTPLCRTVRHTPWPSRKTNTSSSTSSKGRFASNLWSAHLTRDTHVRTCATACGCGWVWMCA